MRQRSSIAVMPLKPHRMTGRPEASISPKAREDVPGDKRLVAYVRSVASHEKLIKELRTGLKQGLPPYMIPSELLACDSLPVSVNFKTDRARLAGNYRDHHLKAQHQRDA